MKITVDARAPGASQVDLLAVPIASDEVRRSRLAPRLTAVDRSLGDEVSRVAALTLLVARGQNLRASREAAKFGVIIAESQNAARELSNLPPNVLSPEQLALEARAVARDAGLTVKVFDVPELERRKMGAILAVGGGSSRPPRLIALEYAPKGAAKKSP